MGLFRLLLNLVGLDIEEQDEQPLMLGASNIQTNGNEEWQIKQMDKPKQVKKANSKKLQKNINSYETRSALDEYYFDDLPIPQKYTVDILPEKRYDYAFNSASGKYTIGITCYGKQSVAGYELDVCEVVHINNVTNVVTILENIMGVLDREKLKASNPYHKQYVNTLILKGFAEERLDKIITVNKGHFGMVRYNKEKQRFQLCSIKPVIEKLNQYYSQAINDDDIIPMDAINLAQRHGNHGYRDYSNPYQN